MPETLILVDANNLLLRSFYAYPDLRAPDGSPTGAVYGAANRVREAVALFSASRVVACWDGGRSSWRRAAFAPYKDRPSSLGRQDLAECFAQRRPIGALLAAMGVDQVEVGGVEADDLIAWYADRAGAFGDRVVILSTDRDFYQLVDEITSVYYGVAPGKGREVEHVTLQNFRRATTSTALESGVADPGEWAAYRIVNGDRSDGIPGVRGLAGEKRWPRVYAALRKMGYDGDAQAFFIGERYDAGDVAVDREVLLNWNLLERNAVLMDLRFAVGMLAGRGVDPERAVARGRFSERAVEVACAKHNFQSALRAWGDWRDALRGLAERRAT